MKHCMKLDKAPFKAVKDGEKCIEMRLYDEKRRAISVGDEIEFTCTDGGARLSATVGALYVFKDFKELYSALPASDIGYKGREDSADYRDMYAYYSREKIDECGVVGIGLRDVKPL